MLQCRNTLWIWLVPVLTLLRPLWRSFFVEGVCWIFCCLLMLFRISLLYLSPLQKSTDSFMPSLFSRALLYLNVEDPTYIIFLLTGIWPTMSFFKFLLIDHVLIWVLETFRDLTVPRFLKAFTSSSHHCLSTAPHRLSWLMSSAVSAESLSE